MLINSAAYKIGGIYGFHIIENNGKEVKITGTLLEKQTKKLLLKLDDGVEKVFSYNDLTPLTKAEQNKERVAKEKRINSKFPRMPQSTLKQEVKQIEPPKNPLPKTVSEKVVDPLILELPNFKTIEDLFLSSRVNIEELVKSESKEDHKYCIQCIRRDLRLFLKKYVHVESDPTWTFDKILGAMKTAWLDKK